MPGLTDNPLFQLTLQMASQRQQQEAREEQNRQRRADSALTTGLDFIKSGVASKDVIPLLRSRGLDSDSERFLAGVEKSLKKSQADQSIATDASGLASASGALAAGRSGAGGIQQQPTPTAQKTAGEAIRDALVLASQSSQPDATRGLVERDFLSAKAAETVAEQRKGGDTSRALEQAEITRTRKEAETRRAADRSDSTRTRDLIGKRRKEIAPVFEPFEKEMKIINRVASTAPKALKGNRQAQVAMIFEFVKSRDGTAVRDGERILIGNAVGVPERVMNAIAQLNEGRVLNQTSIREIVDVMAGEFQVSMDDAAGLEEFHRASLGAEGFTNSQIGAVIRPVGGRADKALRALGRIAGPAGSRGETPSHGQIKTSDDLFRAKPGLRQ